MQVPHNNFKIKLAQLNYKVGDFEFNYNKMHAAFMEAMHDATDLVVFSELAAIGYPPRDLLLQAFIQEQALATIQKLAKATKDGPAILVGGIHKQDNNIYNAAFLLDNGEIQKIILKKNLPNYGIFDEKRWFTSGDALSTVKVRGYDIGVLICEDMWHEDLALNLQQQGAGALVVINASPFELGKVTARINLVKKHAKNTGLPILYLNQIGGQDEVVFDGNSFVIDENSELYLQAAAFKEDIINVALTPTAIEGKTKILMVDQNNNEDKQIVNLYQSDKYAEIYAALALGLKDYVEKNGFKSVLIGMSGGIDSAITAVIAARTLGSNNVKLIMLPSKYTSKASLDDAKLCAENIGVGLLNIDIEPVVVALNEALKPTFLGLNQDITEENMQARARGNILMAVSNKFGDLLLTTGNKSELAVGYATLYGDMCGGFNLLKDLYKTEVYRLAAFINKDQEIIPSNIINKAPTAELRENQLDQDSLPPYEVLDGILELLIEKRKSVEEVVLAGFDVAIVRKVAHLVKFAEYKRFQAAPGVKITSMVFGQDWRYPISCKIY